ncbi:MAG TPA: tetratricopeptide repeat protein [Longimicrobiales bacterium]|nr:tetratricopeptide repeat protein [Longimicrobiales bacterium]
MFVSGVERTVAWARKHQRTLSIAVVAVILLVAGFLYYVNYQRTLETQATQRFTELQGTIASGNFQLAIRDLQGFVDRFGSTEAGRQARLVLAEILLQEGQARRAGEVLGTLAEDVDEPLGMAAARVQAAAFEAVGDHEQAIRLYLRIADAARFPFQARESLADAARVRLQNGDADAAADLYERVLGTFDTDEAGRGYFEMWLAEARARAAAGGNAAPLAPGVSPDPVGPDTGSLDTDAGQP